jgi:hypothetical protein
MGTVPVFLQQFSIDVSEHKHWMVCSKGHFFSLFLNFIIHMCIQGLGHFSLLPPPPPLPPTPPPPSPPYPLNTQQKLFCPYF